MKGWLKFAGLEPSSKLGSEADTATTNNENT